MTQATAILYPIADTLTTGWKDAGGGTTSLYASIDAGVFSPNDSDWIEATGIVGGPWPKATFQMTNTNVKPLPHTTQFDGKGAMFYARIAARDMRADAAMRLDEIWWYDSHSPVATIASGLVTNINVAVTNNNWSNVSGQMLLASEIVGGWDMQNTFLHTKWSGTALTGASGIRISEMEIQESGELVALSENITLYIQGAVSLGCSGRLTEDLISYWKMDESGQVQRQDSVGTNHLSVDGTVYDDVGATHITNRAVGFDYPQDSTLRHIDNGELSRGNSDISIFCWVKVTENYGNTGQKQTIVDKSNGIGWQDKEFQLGLSQVGGSLSFMTSFGDGVNTATWAFYPVVLGGSVELNRWYHVGIVFQNLISPPNSRLRAYVDGNERLNSLIGVSGHDSPGDFVVGGDGSVTARFFDGLVDELGYWKRALNSGEIGILYNSRTGFPHPFCPNVPLFIEGTVPNSSIPLYIGGIDDFNCLDNYQSGLLAYWKLEEQNSTRYDSYSTNHLTDVSGTTFQNPGLVGHAASFNRTQNQHLIKTNQTALTRGDNDFTISAWTFLHDLNSDSVFVSNSIDPSLSGSTDYALRYSASTNRYGFSLSNGTTVTTVPSLLNFPVASAWRFLTGTYQKATDTASLFINGYIDSTVTVDRASFTHSSGNFAIGAMGTATAYSGVMNGYIDEVGIWNRVLTSGEITRLYSGNGQLGLTYPFCPITIPLFIEGMVSSSGDIPLFIHGELPESGNIPLYIGGQLSASGNTTLYISGKGNEGFFPLFIKGKEPELSIGNIPLYMFASPTGVGARELTIPLYIGGLGAAGHLPLYIGGPAFGTVTAGPFPLFLKCSGNLDGSITQTSNCTLYLENKWTAANNNTTLFVSGEGLTAGAGVSKGFLPLYIGKGNDLVQNGITLVINGPSGINSNISLFIPGGNLTASSGMTLVIPETVGPINSGMMLYSHGF